jgi:tRNA 2-selenouridine synthase
VEAKLIVPKIKIGQVLEGSFSLIDVRSPSEFEEFHIPGAISLPIFSDEERAEVGTIYKQKGQEYAKDHGVTILSKKLPELYQKVKELTNRSTDKSIVVYCWRGGMRSKSITSFMGMLEIPILQLEGGIRSYRQLIMNELEQTEDKTKKYIVVEGLTGSKKTDILKELEHRNYPVINIEELANHRGSIFGHIGLQPRSQKEFESLLYHRLIELRESPYYIIEAESKRVGNVILPEFLLAGKEAGTRIHLEMEVEKRAETICETYRLDENTKEFEASIERLKKRLPSDLYIEITELLNQRDFQSIVEILLKEYYDPKYDYASQKYSTPIHTIHITSLIDGVEKVVNKIDELVTKHAFV